MIVLSEALALTQPANYRLDTPVFGWASRVDSIAATSSAAGFPASNLLNPSTALRWKADAPTSPPADVYLEAVLSGVDPVDYLAVAMHNFGDGAHPLSVEGSIGGSPLWFPLAGPQIVANNDPIVFRFTPQALSAIRLRIQPGSVTPAAAVLYAGKLLVCERGTHADHIPINLARTTRKLVQRSEQGDYLGTVILSRGRSSTFALQYLRGAWYDAEMDPFIRAAEDTPFFFAPWPSYKPRDVGFCTISGNPQPTEQIWFGTKSISLEMAGIAE